VRRHEPALSWGTERKAAARAAALQALARGSNRLAKGRSTRSVAFVSTLVPMVAKRLKCAAPKRRCVPGKPKWNQSPTAGDACSSSRSLIIATVAA
jgi:hypothetical protein